MKYTVSLLLVLLVVSAAAQSRIKVACVGNSITEGAGLSKGMSYPEQLQQMLGDQYEVRNYGLGGRTLLRKGDLPYWQEEMYQEVLAWIPDLVIIKLGTNDSKPQNWIYSEEFENDYRNFIQSFRKLPGKRGIYICTPIPVFKDAWGITESIVKEEIIPVIMKVGRAEGVSVIDLYSPMLGKGDLVPDGVHPNEAGATIIAGEISRFVKSTTGISKQ